MGKNISGVIYFPGGSFLEIICLRDNYVSEKSSERQFSSGAISRGILSRINYLWGNFLGAIIREQSSREELSGGNFPRGLLSSGAIVWGAIIQGVIIRGAIFRGAIVLEPPLSIISSQFEGSNWPFPLHCSKVVKKIMLNVANTTFKFNPLNPNF